MIRRCMCAVMLTGLLLSMNSALAAGVNLTDVRYSVEGGHSRVALKFDGEIRYSPAASDGVVRLSFSGTGVAIPLRARRQLPGAGLVSAIAVTPVTADSMVVAIMLRPSTTYRCILPASGDALYVDVVPAGNGSSVSHTPVVSKHPPALLQTAVPPGSRVLPKGAPRGTAKPAVTPAATPKPPEVQAVRAPSGSVIDIPAVAREQLHTVPAPASVTPAVPVSAGIAPAVAALLSLAVVLVLTGSGAALALALRRKPATTSPVIAPAQPAAAPALRDYFEPEGAESVSAREELDTDDESEFAHETSLQLARTFRRGSEEITLARRLHEHATPQWSGGRMEETLSKATTPNQRLHFARKLGVGRGEMDLAMKLRTIRPAEKREGVAS